MLPRDFQILENKVIFTFIKNVQAGIGPDELEFSDYYNKASEHFYERFGTQEYTKYIFYIFFNNLMSNIKYQHKVDKELINKYLKVFQSINPDIPDIDIDLIQNACLYWANSTNTETSMETVINTMITYYSSALVNVDCSPLVLYWYQQALLNAFSKAPYVMPEAAAEITEQLEETTFKYNTIISKLKGAGEVLWQ